MSKEATVEGAAASAWDKRYGDGDAACAREPDGTDPIDYTQHDFLFRHLVCKPATGIPTPESFEFLMRSIFGRVKAEHVLAVGSGLAISEQSLVAAGIVGRIDAYEFSEVAVASARGRIEAAGLAGRLGIHAGDVTKAGLEENTFDAVFVNAAIHHFFNIEEMFDLFYKVLKPGGILVYNEYVGPDHHMYDEKVMSILDKMNACLDERLRFDVLRSRVRDHVPRATLDWMMQMDPSEGVHSSMILPLTYQKFDVIERFDFGGTLMRPFWVGILNNFDFSDPKDQTIARLIGLVEELLLDGGQIPTYHTIVSARKGIQDPNKPLMDNAVISYKTFDFEHGKLLKSIVNPNSVLTCESVTDENWIGGVIRGGPLRLLLPETREVLRILESGKRVVLGHDKAALIESFERISGNIILNCSDETFDRSEIGSPARFWISSF